MNGIAARYQRFAQKDAAERPASYETLAKSVAHSPVALAFLERLPVERRQPNLFFAALRRVAEIPSSVQELDHTIVAHAEAVAEIMLTRTTQTNEPGRCAPLLPSLARIEVPVALMEVGASAGLCLLPDAYGYDWGWQKLAPPPQYGLVAPVFPCRASENTPIPDRHPEIVWRAGLDLNPLDVSKVEDVAWLETLVWPEHDERLDRLRKAVRIAQAERPRCEPACNFDPVEG